MILKVVGRSLDVVFAALLIKKQSQLECCLSLSLPIKGTVCDVKHLSKIFNRHACVTIFAFTLGQSFVSLAKLILVLVFDANFEEPIQVFNRTLHLILSFVDQSNLFVAFSFFDGIVGTTGDI